MKVQDLFVGSSELRYALRDSLKTRYSDSMLLAFFNRAAKAIARDTLYFHGMFEIRVVAGQARYKLDRRILKVFQAYTEHCTYNLLSPSKPVCTKRAGYKIRKIMPSYGQTKEIIVYPVLSEIPNVNATFDGIVIDNDVTDTTIPTFGVTLQIGDDGNILPIIAAYDNYIPVALLCAYEPDDFELDSDVPDAVIDVLEAIKLYIVHIVNSQSGIQQADRISKDALSEYAMLAAKYKKLVTSKFMKVPYTVQYRTPFSRPQPIEKDF